MHTKWMIGILIVYIALFLAHSIYLQKAVYGDGVFYVSWLRSVIFDHDIQFANEFSYYHIRSATTPTGLPANKFSIGTPLLWAPLYLFSSYVFRGSGFELPYQIILGLTTILYVCIGLVYVKKTLEMFFSTSVALITTISLAFATHLLFYGAIDPVNSHGVSFFAASMFLYYAIQNKKQWILLGMLLGLIAAIRLQDILLGLILVPFVRPRTLMHLVFGFLSIFWIQLLAWQSLYGSMFINPYVYNGEYFDFFHPHIIDVLFSATNGLFIWTPVVAGASIGLFYVKHMLARWFLLVCFLELYLVSSWSTWLEGASFSGRMFISVLPILSFGIAAVYHQIGQHKHSIAKSATLLICAISINCALIFSFLLHT